METEMQTPPLDKREMSSIKRPLFLSILCILTYIGSGMLFLSSIFMLFFSGIILEMMLQYGINLSVYASGTSIRMAAITGIVLSIASIIAAIKMWHLEKFGFWIYLTVQGVSILLSFSVISILINALFVLLYYANYKYMVK